MFDNTALKKQSFRYVRKKDKFRQNLLGRSQESFGKLTNESSSISKNSPRTKNSHSPVFQ